MVTVDLTAAVSGNGTVSFALTHPAGNANNLAYAATNHATVAYRPQLALIIATGTAATPSSTVGSTTTPPAATSTPTPTTATPPAMTPTATAPTPPTTTPSTTPSTTPTSIAALTTTLTFTATADTFVDQTRPISTFQSWSYVAIQGSSNAEKQAFLRFTVSGVPPGAGVQSAKLRLFVADPAPHGGIVQAMTDTTWLESMTWTTRPPIAGPVLATLGTVALSQVVEVNLTGVITGDGTYSFAITHPGGITNELRYASRTSSIVANRPQLLLVTGAGMSPTATATATPSSTATATPSPTSLAAGCDDAYEENDTPAQAKPFTVPGTQAHRFCYQYDEDWVRLTVAAGTTYSMETVELGANIDPLLELYASNGTTLLASDDDSGAEYHAARLVHTFSAAGTYYLKVRGSYYGNDGMATATYSLRTWDSSSPTPTPRPCTDAFEPNDVLAQAVTVTVGLTQTHR